MEKEKFISIIKEHQKLIYKVCNVYCKNPGNRKDLEQEILLQLWKSFKKYDGRAKLSSWIYKIALNTAISCYRDNCKHTNKIGSVIGLFYLISALIKANKFVQLDYYNTDVIGLQKEIAELSSLILRFRKIELGLLPFLVIAILPIAFKSIHNIDIFSNIKLFIIEIAFILGISFPVGIWTNRNIYDKKIRNAKQFLRDIERFEGDEKEGEA